MYLFQGWAIIWSKDGVLSIGPSETLVNLESQYEMSPIVSRPQYINNNLKCSVVAEILSAFVRQQIRWIYVQSHIQIWDVFTKW